MPKGMVVGREAATAAVGMRQTIHELEIGVVNIKGRREGVLDLLKMRDQVEDDMVRLRKQGMDLRPEMTRIEIVDGIFARKAGQIGHELRGIGGLAGARRSENPPRDRAWWFVDLALAERRRKAAIKSGAILVGVLVLLLGANYVLGKFFGMNPIEKQAHSHTTQAEQYLREGDYANAIAEYEQAVAILPSLEQAQAQLGVLYEMQGHTQEAQAAFSAAETAVGNRANYLVVLAQAYQMVEKTQTAMDSIQEALIVNPDLARAYLIRGGLYEQTNKRQEALADYERAASLAHEQGDDPLYVIAKVRLGMSLQTGIGAGGAGQGS